MNMRSLKRQMYDVVVVGGGAAGCMAALTAADHGAKVLLLERNPKIGRKLYITGKGRCNVTNCCDVAQCLKNIPRNSRFLFGALTKFPPDQVMCFFEDLGVPLKVERGNRVFPRSDRAADVIDALLKALRQKGVVLRQERVTSLEVENGTITAVKGAQGEMYPCKAVVLATGGCSYPATGSTGDGYRMAREAGHSLCPCRGSLVPLEAENCEPMQGLSLRNVELTLVNEAGKILFQEQGELLFTHFGLSGPLVLSASAHLGDGEKERHMVRIDLKPALDQAALDHRLVRELSDGANKELRHILEKLEPRSLIPAILRCAGMAGDERGNSITKVQRRALLDTLKGLTIPIIGPRPVEEAIVTAGGILVSEVSPKDMGSKCCKGLFLAGEILDVDAYTGGFNLQIAWATGRAAGLGAATFLGGEENDI